MLRLDNPNVGAHPGAEPLGELCQRRPRAGPDVPEIQIDRDLRERLIVPGFVDNFDEIWERSWRDPVFAVPGCESSRAAQDRICGAVARIARASRAARLLISSHGNLLSLLINSVDPGFGIAQASAMRNPDVLRMSYAGAELTWDAGFRLPALDSFATAWSSAR